MYLSSSEALGGCRVDPPNQYLTSWARVRPPPPRDPSNATPYSWGRRLGEAPSSQRLAAGSGATEHEK